MARTFQLTIDCRDPAVLVPFWSLALGYVPRPPPDGFASWNAWYLSVGVSAEELAGDGDGTDRLTDPDGIGPPIWFQVVPEPKTVKNRLHLDLDVAFNTSTDLSHEERRRSVDAKVDELVAAGAHFARREDDPEHGHFYVVLTDPEGNEFCLR